MLSLPLRPLRLSWLSWVKTTDSLCVALMACALFVYLVPVLLGFAWNSLGSPYNALDPPERYIGRSADSRIAVEAWGAAVVSVPNHIKTHIFAKSGELPLWNPYQGLGQPFAAMGEGNPYFPPAILRSIAPYSMANWFSILNVFISQIFFFFFLRNLGLASISSAFGGIAFALSGAISFHLARTNMLDQICMMPVLFWAVSHAVKIDTFRAYVVLAVVTALHAMAGFIQVAMLSQMLALLFGGTTIVWADHAMRSRLTRLAALTIATLVGLGVCSFYLMPLLEWLVTGVGKDYPFLAFFKSPTANIGAFFFPLGQGPWFVPRWMPPGMGTLSAPDWVVDWNNLFAVAGTTVLLLSLSALASKRWQSPMLRIHYFFFLSAGIVLIMRYMNLPPASSLNILPVIGRQSPKHATAVMVFAFVACAAICVDQIKNLDVRKALLVMLGTVLFFASMLITLLGTYLFWSYQTDTVIETAPLVGGLPYIGLSALVVASVVLVFVKSTRLAIDRPGQVGFLLCVLVACELMLYVPLGNAAGWFLAARVGISVGVLLTGLAAIGHFGVPRIAAASMSAVTLVAYGLLVALPSVGLPNAFDLTKPPRFMRWLSKETDSRFRSFGIFPDYSVAAKLQDIGVVGPLAPYEFRQFVRLVSSERTYNSYTGHFLLAGPWHYDLETYDRSRPILDWAGLKYFVIDRLRIGPPQIEQLLALKQMAVAYSDARVTILASQSARPKAEFWAAAIERTSQAEILSALAADPRLILGAPLLERSEAGGLHGPSDQTSAQSQPATVVNYTLNRVAVELPPHSGTGILVLKDIFAPGWRAWVDGQQARVLRVNGMFRGIEVSRPNAHLVVTEYRPSSFSAGVIQSLLAVVVSVFFLFCPGTLRQIVPGERDRVHRVLTSGSAVAAVLAVIFFIDFALTYFQTVSPLTAFGSYLSREISP